ncbi:GAD-like domain-containing protein [Chryseobacterium vaccae]|uniref:GAD-like domain-containing protein n=1 Tax=Chryseobacterium vaccae TaxID=2604424 RepID=UPI0021CE9FFD|nr:GAD-like domain-containing protein [Chryseobacterium vaccae]
MGFMETSENYANADDELIDEYRGVFMDPKDETDVITEIWKKYGFCLYKNGLFSLLNPKEYNRLARNFPEVSEKAEVFARTATGCLFLWEEYSFGRNIAFLNIHTGEKSIISTSFNVLIEWNLTASNYWTEDCYGKVEFAVMDRFKHIPNNQCGGYSLALPLGGKERLDHMELFNYKTHLELLSQLHH